MSARWSLLLLASIPMLLWGQSPPPDDPCHYARPPAADTLKPTAPQPKSLAEPKHRWTYLIEAQASAHVLSAPRPTCKMQIGWKQELEYRYRHQKLETALECRDELQIQAIPDSLLEKLRDALVLRYRIERKADDTTRLSAQFSAQFQTPKFKGKPSYEIHKKQARNEGFLNPAQMLFAAGVRANWPGIGHLELGLASLKLSWMNDTILYTLQNTQTLHGIPRDPAYLLDGGWSLQSQWKYAWKTGISWDNRLQFFAGFTGVPKRELEWRSEWSLPIGKQIKTTLRSVYTYQSNRWPPALLQGELGLAYSWKP